MENVKEKSESTVDITSTAWRQENITIFVDTIMKAQPTAQFIHVLTEQDDISTGYIYVSLLTDYAMLILWNKKMLSQSMCSTVCFYNIVLH